MKLRIAISRLLAALAVLGLLIAPLTSPALAMSARVSAMGDHMAGAEDAATAMPADMPCCPDEAPVTDCAEDCPLTAICMANNLQTAPAPSLDLPLSFGSVMLPGNDAELAGLRHGPPPRPPRT